MSMMNTSFDETFQTCLQKHQSHLESNDLLFIQRIYGTGLKKYQDRIDSYGLTNSAKVLDAGCGFGQWSLALAMKNRHVCACDVSPERIAFLADMAAQLALPNIETTVSGLESMPYEDECFDSVFCYGVIFLTHWRRSLLEVRRVLKRGGRLYVNANGLGWHLFLWKDEHNKTTDYDPKMVAARAMLDTLRYERECFHEPGMDIIIEPGEIHAELKKLGFDDIQMAHEGGLHVNPLSPAPVPFFKGEYYGQVGCFEVMARKREA